MSIIKRSSEISINVSTAEPAYNYALLWYRQKAAEVRTEEQAREFREGIERAVETCAGEGMREGLRRVRDEVAGRSMNGSINTNAV